MELVGIMVDLCARQGVDGRRGQGNIGPVGPIGFAGLGSSLGLLFLPALSTYTRKRKWQESLRARKRKKMYEITEIWTCSREKLHLMQTSGYRSVQTRPWNNTDAFKQHVSGRLPVSAHTEKLKVT